MKELLDSDSEKSPKERFPKKNKIRKYRNEEREEHPEVDTKDTIEVLDKLGRMEIIMDKRGGKSRLGNLRKKHLKVSDKQSVNSGPSVKEDLESIPETTEASTTESLDDIPSLGPLNDLDPNEDANDSDIADEDIPSLKTYHPAKRSCPVFLHPEVHRQTVDIHPLITDNEMYSIQCVFVKNTESVPSEDYLLMSLIHNSPILRSIEDNPIITLSGPELATVKQVACMVASSDFSYFPAIILNLPLDVEEESPDLTVFIESEFPNSVQYRVDTTIPCFLWCAPFLVDSPPPSVTELKHYPKRYLRSQWSFTHDHLQPESLYDMYCYAESVRGSPMKISLEKTKAPFETPRGGVTFDY